jgi:hypothetical protein
VVYFLVLTSVVVHGVTIPIGKGLGRTFTLTRSTGASGNNLISRLPPPLPIGGQLSEPVSPGMNNVDGRQSPTTPTSQVPENVHFDGKAKVDGSTPGIQWGEATVGGSSVALSGTVTPVTRASTPVLVEDAVESPIGIIKRTAVKTDSPV